MGIDREIMVQLTLSACIKMVAMVAFASASTGTGIVLDDADSQYEQKITGDNTGYPDESDYLIYRVGIAAGAGIVIALFSCICGVCFCCVQTCSNMCKCCERNCSCCGAGEPDPLGYTVGQRRCLVFILFIGWGMIVIGAGIAYKGNDDVKVGIDHLATTSSTLADEIYSQVQMGYDAGTAVGASLDASMVTDAGKLRDDVKSGVKTIQDNDNIRVLAVQIFYAIMMAVPLLGFMAWCCSSGKWSFIMTQLCFCMLFFAWILFGITLATGTILDDTCIEAGKHVYGEPNALSELLKCDAGTAGQANYDKIWETLDINQNSYSDPPLFYTPVVMETTYGFTTNTYSIAAGIIEGKKYDDNRALLLGMYTVFSIQPQTCLMMTDTTKTNLCFVPGITSATYPAMCGSSGTEPTSKRCLQQGQILSAAGMVGSSYLIACEHLNFIALELNNKICGPMVTGLVNVTIGQGFIGSFYFLVMIAGCMGINRFNNENDAENRIQEMNVVPNPTYDSSAVHPEDELRSKADTRPSASVQLQQQPGTVSRPSQNEGKKKRRPR